MADVNEALGDERAALKFLKAFYNHAVEVRARPAEGRSGAHREEECERTRPGGVERAGRMEAQRFALPRGQVFLFRQFPLCRRSIQRADRARTAHQSETARPSRPPCAPRRRCGRSPPATVVAQVDDRAAVADGAKRLVAIYVGFANKAVAQFGADAAASGLPRAELAELEEEELNRLEEEDLKFLCVNARERARTFGRVYRELQHVWIWQSERLDWQAKAVKKAAF